MWVPLRTGFPSPRDRKRRPHRVPAVRPLVYDSGVLRGVFLATLGISAAAELALQVRTRSDDARSELRMDARGLVRRGGTRLRRRRRPRPPARPALATSPGGHRRDVGRL